MRGHAGQDQNHPTVQTPAGCSFTGQGGGCALGFVREPTAERCGILNKVKQLLFSAHDKIKGEELREDVESSGSAKLEAVWRSLEGH